MSQGLPLSALAPLQNYSIQNNKGVTAPINNFAQPLNLQAIELNNTHDMTMTKANENVIQPTLPENSEIIHFGQAQQHTVSQNVDKNVNQNVSSEQETHGKNQEKSGKLQQYTENISKGWGWVGALILWFIIFTVLFWLIYYSLKPTFVLSNYSNTVDTAKVLLSAVISSIILVIIIWLVKLAVTRK